jgi:hypothetical protein
MGKAHYINPGNPLFDCLVDTVRDLYRDEMMKGTVLVSPDDRDAYLAFYVKNQITDNRPSKDGDNVANENLALVCKDLEGNFSVTSPAKLIDLDIPTQYAKEITPPEIEDEQDVMAWSFEKIAMPLFESTKQKVEEDNEARRQYLEEAFNRVIEDLDGEINELQGEFRRERVVRLDPPVPRARAGLDEGEVDRRIGRRVQVDDDVVLADKVQSVVADDSDPPRTRCRRSRDYRHVRRRRRARRYLRERRDEACVTVAVRRAVEESRPVGERRLAQCDRGALRFHKNRHADVSRPVDRGERTA